VGPSEAISNDGAVSIADRACYDAARRLAALKRWRCVMRKISDFENLPSFQHHA